MTNTIKYNGSYTDDFGKTEIVIENDYDYLYVEIDGVKFRGSELSDLRIIDRLNYSKAQLERFKYSFTRSLCSCSFKVLIPQIIIDKMKNTQLDCLLSIELLLGNENPEWSHSISEDLKLSLSIGEYDFEGRGECFESIFDRIQKQFDNRYYLKNCYGCMYGDYSVYGNSNFGTMLCFVNQKEQYLKVKNKDDYMNLESDFETVQEIFCCDKFEIRKKGVGYR